MTERILEVNDLHVSFDISAGEVQAVRGVDFYLNKGILSVIYMPLLYLRIFGSNASRNPSLNR
jgi:hypothetical protein